MVGTTVKETDVDDAGGEEAARAPAQVRSGQDTGVDKLEELNKEIDRVLLKCGTEQCVKTAENGENLKELEMQMSQAKSDSNGSINMQSRLFRMSKLVTTHTHTHTPHPPTRGVCTCARARARARRLPLFGVRLLWHVPLAGVDFAPTTPTTCATTTPEPSLGRSVCCCGCTGLQHHRAYGTTPNERYEGDVRRQAFVYGEASSFEERCCIQ